MAAASETVRNDLALFLFFIGKGANHGCDRDALFEKEIVSKCTILGNRNAMI
jgi:hypothetical protein